MMLYDSLALPICGSFQKHIVLVLTECNAFALAKVKSTVPEFLITLSMYEYESMNPVNLKKSYPKYIYLYF